MRMKVTQYKLLVGLYEIAERARGNEEKSEAGQFWMVRGERKVTKSREAHIIRICAKL